MGDALKYRPDLNCPIGGDSEPWMEIERGEFAYHFDPATGEPDRIGIWIPSYRTPVYLPIKMGMKTDKHWHFDGPLESPSLQPSVWINKDHPPDWHGFITNGVAINAG